MTPDQLLQTAAAMTAYAEGKPVQFQIIGTNEWTDATKPEWNCMAYVYRPKPEARRQFEIDLEAFFHWWDRASRNNTLLHRDAWNAALEWERSSKP